MSYLENPSENGASLNNGHEIQSYKAGTSWCTTFECVCVCESDRQGPKMFVFLSHNGMSEDQVPSASHDVCMHP